MENRGVIPDVTVDISPAEYSRREDPQLDTAVREALRLLKDTGAAGVATYLRKIREDETTAAELERKLTRKPWSFSTWAPLPPTKEEEENNFEPSVAPGKIISRARDALVKIIALSLSRARDSSLFIIRIKTLAPATLRSLSSSEPKRLASLPRVERSQLNRPAVLRQERIRDLLHRVQRRHHHHARPSAHQQPERPGLVRDLQRVLRVPADVRSPRRGRDSAADRTL